MNSAWTSDRRLTVDQHKEPEMTDIRTRNDATATAVTATLDAATQLLADRGHTRHPEGADGRLDIWYAICQASPGNHHIKRLAKWAVEQTAGVDLYRWEKDRAGRDATSDVVALMVQARDWYRNHYEQTGWAI